MSPSIVTTTEWAWREWFLGEGDFKPHGRRNPAVRSRTGAPARIPPEWWQRLEEFLARRHDAERLEPARNVPARKLVRAIFPRLRADGATLVSEHFRLAEFNCRDGTVVPKAAVPALVKLAAVFLEPVRAEFGPVIVTSGYRHAAYNRRIGGAARSEHIYDLTPEAVAADLIPLQGTPREWAIFARELAERRGVGGVGQYDHSGFVHVDTGPRRNWWG